jgi:PmbA protein
MAAGTKSKRGRAGTRRQGAVGSAADHRVSAAVMRRLAERVIALSDADETEVEIDAVSSALTRFANNTIHQNVAEQNVNISVRTVFDGRTARATTNKTDEESLRRVVAASSSLARMQPRNPDLLPMPKQQKLQKVQRYFAATAAATPADRAREVARVCKEAARAKQTAAGVFATSLNEQVLANSRGLFASYEQTQAEFSVTILESDSSGWAKSTSPDIRELQPGRAADSATEKAVASRSPRELAPERYVTILEPPAVLDLVGFLFYDFAGTAVLDKRSVFTDRMGKKLFGSNITIWDDVYHPLQTGVPFDGEGMAREKVLLVKNGVPRALVYSRATAKKMKTKPTGHGFALPNDYGEAPMNLVFAGGDTSLDDMIRSTERGVLVTRLWYIREVDPYEKTLTGMTRDGTFLIENGKIAGGIRNFRFNQSMIEMLSNVSEMGAAVHASGEESFDMVVPPMKINNFHFTEVTKF